MLMSALGVYLDDRFAAVGHGLLNDFYYGSPYVRCTYLLIGMMVCAAHLWLKDKADERTKISFETVVCILSVIYFFSRRSILDAFNENLVAIRAFDLLNSMTVLQALAFGNGGWRSLYHAAELQFLERTPCISSCSITLCACMLRQFLTTMIWISDGQQD